jgi:putative phosphoesterase
MRIAALYDIHGNLPALEAVLDDVRRVRVDRVVVGGDVVPGPMARQTIEALLNLDVPVQFIRGNGEREVLARMRGIETGAVPERFREVIRWSGEQIRDHEALVDSWPPTLRLQVADADVLFCHATPRNDMDIFTRQTPDDRLLPIFQPANAALVVCGHTHMQFDRTIGSTRVVNAGSVGMPFSGPGANWLLLAPDVQLRRTAYDLERAAQRIRASGYPQAEDFADRNVLHPPTEEDTLTAYANAELK